MGKILKEGGKAPDFRLPTDGDGLITLKQLKGETVILYFYPKDDTPGCTREAIDFSGQIAKFKRAGARVIGISRDSVARHDKFKAKHGLKVTLAADETGKMTEDYGVWVEKTLYGRKYMGVERATFLIDGKGVIARIWRKVKVAGHVDDVLEAVKAL